MRKRLPSVVLLLLLAGSALADTVRVQRVIDGDTLLLSDGRRVRMIGIDTPETHPSSKLKRDAERARQDVKIIQALGKRSTAFVRSVVEGQTVRLEYERTNRVSKNKDRYGRTLAYIYFKPRPCDELDRAVAEAVCELGSYEKGFLNALILEAGYANVYSRYPFKELETFRGLERSAREAERGLWAPTSQRTDAAPSNRNKEALYLTYVR